jgi:hypothetical protein
MPQSRTRMDFITPHRATVAPRHVMTRPDRRSARFGELPVEKTEKVEIEGANMQRRLPDGNWTGDKDLYSKAWLTFAKKALSYFPGYVLAECTPPFRFERREFSTRTGRYRVVDTVDLSLMAVECLLTQTEPPKSLREDF